MREEFLKKIKLELETKKIINKDELYDHYVSWYDLGIESGLSEEEIEDRLLNDLEKEVNKNEKSFWNFEENKEEDTNINNSYQDAFNVEVQLLSEDVVYNLEKIEKPIVDLDDLDINDYIISVSENNVTIKEKYGFRKKKKDGTVTIRVPWMSNFGFISIQTLSGDISSDKIKGEEIKLNTLSGEIDVDEIETKNLTLNVTSGDIDIDKIESTEMKLNSISGDINIDRIRANSIKTNSTSGDFYVDEIETNELSIYAISGDIDINIIKATDAKVISTSGDINVDIFETENEALISTLSGDITIKKTNNEMNIKSLSGECIINGIKIDNMTSKINDDVKSAINGIKDFFK